MSVLTRIMMFAVLLLATACVDFDLDEPFICRTQNECGEGFQCLRGPGCYCVCKTEGEDPEPGCEDPTCEAVETGN